MKIGLVSPCSLCEYEKKVEGHLELAKVWLRDLTCVAAMAQSKVLKDQRVIPAPCLTFDEVKERLVAEYPFLATHQGPLQS